MASTDKDYDRISRMLDLDFESQQENKGLAKRYEKGKGPVYSENTANTREALQSSNISPFPEIPHRPKTIHIDHTGDNRIANHKPCGY